MTDRLKNSANRSYFWILKLFQSRRVQFSNVRHTMLKTANKKIFHFVSCLNDANIIYIIKLRCRNLNKCGPGPRPRPKLFIVWGRYKLHMTQQWVNNFGDPPWLNSISFSSAQVKWESMFPGQKFHFLCLHLSFFLILFVHSRAWHCHTHERRTSLNQRHQHAGQAHPLILCGEACSRWPNTVQAPIRPQWTRTSATDTWPVRAQARK